ncbi:MULTISPECIES: Spy/CpxP family protein refolding chaperone [Calothrix]|uniref:P pilus assembly/Cpx signaling pathway, periplasmic inhibitor/zinc-resistance associated protein n=2 Tax=Calothrix TaxID=1186 RepID=A0ABR8A5K1_9CYAN|nr:MULTISPECIES: P pilus assembly/Cpx signaling pathway, periplasmic inhibitor/zinc-resistance associated protein [Calothrix]MBD2194770.1 P pilus assembly/Cpx signaling pathway, periplasmic inhibitor/zinc-resistance associated protein [Calothrix parietina FACHB-288]MBD2225080.1 P pilus assembly/Cpx signaling pathway, periplasmic inhibitor/zinc-resistance associated protein [Calothrix anomala FACHB-343]
MKAQKLSLIAGAIALTLTAIPFTAQAQRAGGSHFKVSQATNQQTPRKGGWDQLGLTDTQKTQIQAIKRDTRNQIEQIVLSRVNLTQEQRDKLNELKAQRDQNQQAPRQRGERGKKGAFAALNLTEEQKTQLKQVMQSAEVRQIMESSQQKIQALLTPEQRQKMQQFRENARARWQQRQQQRNPNQGTQQ